MEPISSPRPESNGAPARNPSILSTGLCFLSLIMIFGCGCGGCGGCAVPVPPPVPPPVPNEKGSPTPTGGTTSTPIPNEKGTSTPLGGTTPAPAPTAFGGTRYALLVGVKEYGSTEFSNLSFPENDVEDLKAAMVKWGYKDENVAVLTNKATDAALKPTARNILARLKGLAAKCGPSDVLFVGLSGHGFQPAAGGKNYFCGFGARKADPASLVDIDDVYAAFNTSKAGMKLLCVDACRNTPGERAARDAEDGSKSVTAGDVPPQVLAVFSCASSEKSHESLALKHGVFFHYLIEGYKGAADTDHDGQLSWSELVGYLQKSVDVRVKEEFSRTQTVEVISRVTTKLPLADGYPGGGGGGKPDASSEFKDTIEANNVTYKLTEWGWSGKKVYFWMTATNHKADRYLTLYAHPNTANLVDEQGDTQSLSRGICGGATTETAGQINITAPYEVLVRFNIQFDHVTPNVKKVQVLTVHIDGQRLQFRNIPLGQLSTPSKPPVGPSPPAKNGSLVLQATQKLAPGVIAFLEVDGKKVADWPANESEMVVELAAGEHTVVYRSKFRGAYYKYELGSVKVLEGEKTVKTLPNGPPDPDKGGKW